MAERRKYDKEFKKDTVEYLLRSGMLIKEVAAEFGLNPQVLGRWKKEYQMNKDQAFPGNGKPKDKELYELKKELADIKEERDILKKALAIFSQGKQK